MAIRAFFAVILLATVNNSLLEAQNEVVASFFGRVLAEGRPVEWTLEVRLESEDSSVIGYAHTHGSNEFSFRGVRLSSGARYYFVIAEKGYKELRYQFDIDDLFMDPAPASTPTAACSFSNLRVFPRKKRQQLPARKPSRSKDWRLSANSALPERHLRRTTAGRRWFISRRL